MELLQDIGHRYQDAFGAEDGSSLPMRRGILRWLGLYFGDREDCLRLPYTIVRKLCRGVLCCRGRRPWNWPSSPGKAICGPVTAAGRP